MQPSGRAAFAIANAASALAALAALLHSATRPLPGFGVGVDDRLL